MSAIALSGVTKVYGSGPPAVDGVDLDVGEGEFVALLGPTGCGKTTVLRIVAGLEQATSGTVLLGDRHVDLTPTRERGVAMVFQDFALYPHLTVAENIAFPLHTESLDEATISARVLEMAQLVGVDDLLRRRPTQLSGGQRQRVAMARAIVRRPRAFLLDEPLSNVDAAVRAELRSEIVRLTRALNVGTLYVTHDQTEAMTMADRIAVMRRGRIEQVGTPAEIYGDPQRLFVAAFVGTPRTSLLQAAVYAQPPAEAVLDLGQQVLTLPWSDPRTAVLAAHHNDRVTVGVRPDALRIVAPPGPGPTSTGTGTAHRLQGKVIHLEHLGNEVIVVVDVGGVPTATGVSQLELPDTPGALTDAVAEEPPHHHGVDALRGTLARLVPHAQHERLPATARTRYGFYPVYDPDTQPQPLSLGGTLSVRVTLPAPLPRLRDALTLEVNLDQVFLFDHDGNRIPLDQPPIVADDSSAPGSSVTIPEQRVAGTVIEAAEPAD
jgi:multiple sugar transport system ATP-binding protein